MFARAHVDLTDLIHTGSTTASPPNSTSHTVTIGIGGVGDEYPYETSCNRTGITLGAGINMPEGEMERTLMPLCHNLKAGVFA